MTALGERQRFLNSSRRRFSRKRSRSRLRRSGRCQRSEKAGEKNGPEKKSDHKKMRQAGA